MDYIEMLVPILCDFRLSPLLSFYLVCGGEVGPDRLFLVVVILCIVLAVLVKQHVLALRKAKLDNVTFKQLNISTWINLFIVDKCAVC